MKIVVNYDFGSQALKQEAKKKREAKLTPEEKAKREAFITI